MKQFLKNISFFLFLISTQAYGFCHKEVLATGDRFAFTHVSLEVNNACQAVAGWTEDGIGSFVSIWNETSWSAAEQLMGPSMSETARGMRVAINNNGKAAAVWQQVTGISEAGVLVAVNSGAGWTAGTVLDTISIPNSIGDIYVGVDDSGNIIVVWQENVSTSIAANDVRAGNRGRIRTARSTNCGASWSAPDTLSENGIAPNNNNISTITCAQRIGSQCLSSLSPKAIRPFVISKVNGRAIVIWEAVIDTNHSRLQSAYFTGNSWQKPSNTDFVTLTSDPNLFEFDQYAAINDKGEGAVYWSRGSTVYSNFFNTNGSWVITKGEIVRPGSSQPSVGVNNSFDALSNNNTSPRLDAMLDILSSQVIGTVEKDKTTMVFANSVSGPNVQVCYSNNDTGIVAWASDSNYPRFAFFSNGAWHQNQTNFGLVYDSFVDLPSFTIDCSEDSSGMTTAGFFGSNLTSSDDVNLVAVICCQAAPAGASPPVPFIPLSPGGIRETRLLNSHPMQREQFNTIEWELSKTPDIAAQNIRRNGKIIANIPSTQTSYVEHNRPLGVADNYSVAAVSHVGGILAESVPAQVRPVGVPVISVGLSSSSFPSGGEIPIQFTCQGSDISPELSWRVNVPGTTSISNVKLFLIVVDDPTESGKTVVHWNALVGNSFCIMGEPSSNFCLPENASNTGLGGCQFVNDFGNEGYNGPCPSEGSGTHTYRFSIYALNQDFHSIKSILQPLAPFTAEQASDALGPYILASNVITGKYTFQST